MEILIITISVTAAVITLILVFLRASKNKYVRENEKYAEFRKRRESALWATARVVDAKGGTFGEMGEKLRMTLTLEVTPPDKETYRAHADWFVDFSAIGSFSAGSTIQVKIDALDPKIIYPGSNYASYIPS